MKISKLYYERLVDTGDFSNVRFGAEMALDEEERQLDFSVARDHLVAIVDKEIQRLANRDREQRRIERTADDVTRLEAVIAERRETLSAIDKWMRDNEAFVRAWEAATGNSVVPF